MICCPVLLPGDHILLISFLGGRISRRTEVEHKKFFSSSDINILLNAGSSGINISSANLCRHRSGLIRLSNNQMEEDLLSSYVTSEFLNFYSF